VVKCERVFEIVFKLIVDFRDDFCQWQLHKIVVDYTNKIYICINNYDPCQEERGSKEPCNLDVCINSGPRYPQQWRLTGPEAACMLWKRGISLPTAGVESQNPVGSP
jgi:hypothetical protein